MASRERGLSRETRIIAFAGAAMASRSALVPNWAATDYMAGESQATTDAAAAGAAIRQGELMQSEISN